LFDSNFQEAYLERGVDCYLDFLDEVPSTSIRSKKDKIKDVLALINEIQIQNLCRSDEESNAVPPTKTAMVCKLAQIQPDFWMTLPLEAKKWLLNERKRQ
jgi:hypothetical protein